MVSLGWELCPWFAGNHRFTVSSFSLSSEPTAGETGWYKPALSLNLVVLPLRHRVAVLETVGASFRQLKLQRESNATFKTQPVPDNQLPERNHSKYSLIKQSLPGVLDLLYSQALPDKVIESLTSFKAELSRREAKISAENKKLW